MQRRRFLQGTLAASLATTLVKPSWGIPPNDPLMQNLGLQLYTLRNQLGEDAAGTIETVAKAGYQQVELMEVVGSEKIQGLAKDNGLTITSGFFDWRTVVAPHETEVPKLEAVIEAAQKAKLKYLVFGYIGKPYRKSIDDYRRIAEAANQAGEKISEAGMTMCYHNHSFEFEPHEDDSMGFDIFTERFDAKYVRFELDVFWVAIGGWSPVEMMDRLKGRIAQLHLKDIKPGTETIYDESAVPATAFQEVGDGLVDFRAVLRKAREQGVEQCHVEQDQSPSPLESIAQSYNYLEKLQL